MSHSKRNTSLAYFTAHERSQLRSTWGSQSTRLTRESFLPFGFCRLCLGYAREPVTCAGEDIIGAEAGLPNGSEKTKVQDAPKVHLFCRECALNDLMAQRKEIKRLEKEAHLRGRDESDAQAREQDAQQRRELERFERNELGFSDGEDSSSKKRKREAEEYHSRQGGSTEGATKKAKTKTSESSFWTPGSETTTTSTSLASSTSLAAKAKQSHKLHPECPASTLQSKHAYSLKALVTVNFTTTQDEPESSASGVGPDEASRICPSCNKALTNTSRAMLGTAEGCGHVVCGSCAELFTKGIASKKGVSEGRNGHDEIKVQCFVCEADLSGTKTQSTLEQERVTGRTGAGEKPRSKTEKHNERRVGRLVEISCEGTGFAGGGANMAKREGVVFQC